MRMGAVLGAVALASGVPAQAQGCWDERTVEAAQIRQFDIMLMSAVLRCRAKGVDLLSDYSAFVRRYRPVLAVAADELRGQVGPFVDGPVVPAACETLRETVTATGIPPSRDAVLALARAAGMAAVLPAEVCENRIASSGASPVPRHVATAR